MMLEEILYNIKQIQLYDKNFNYIYRGLNKEECIAIQDQISKLSPIVCRGDDFFNLEALPYKIVVIDFLETDITSIYQAILKKCEIEVEIGYHYEDYLEFLKVLRKRKLGIQLHLFHVEVLPKEAQEIVKNLYLINTPNLFTHTYFEKDYFYSNYKTEKGLYLDDRENIHVFQKFNNQYYLKKGDQDE